MTSATDPPAPATIASFPPESLAAFLASCAGEWLTLRSRFSLADTVAPASGEEETSWHHSERAELKVAYLAPETVDGAGGLEISLPGGGSHRLQFSPDGGFLGRAPGGDETVGRWRLWPDGSLEMTSHRAGATVRERIWFTKANLRLRSSVEHRSDGSLGRASFSSEIRRVSRPIA